MKKYLCFFNLIAALIAKALSFKEYKNIQKLAENEEVQINAFVDNLINRYFGRTINDYKLRLSITFEDAKAIIDALNGKNYYYFSAIIIRLDKIIPDELLYNLLSYKTLSQEGIADKYFESLNDNFDQTGIYILPEISSSNNRLISKEKISHKARLENDLKKSLKKIFFIVKSDLDGYKMVNAVIDCELNNSDYITIASTPLCNIEQSNLINIEKLTVQQNGVNTNLLSVNLKDPLIVGDKFKKILTHCSREKDVDFFLGPEIVGTQRFTSVNSYGFNDEIRMLGDYQLPSIIIPPTYVHNSTNVLTVFANSGEKLGEQHKQVPFDDRQAKEDLRNSQKEIFILHIKEIGRICFAICKDFLTDYADIFIKTLKANLIFCPSYSESVTAFRAAKGVVEAYNCKIVWINCCSAFKNRRKKGAFIGFASGNYIPNSTKFFKCAKEGECNGCYFKIKMPLTSSGERYRDKSIIVKQQKI